MMLTGSNLASCTFFNIFFLRNDFADWSANKFLTDWSEIKKRKPQKINAISAWGDLGGYGIAELPPAGPLFARGPYRALGQKGIGR